MTGHCSPSRVRSTQARRRASRRRVHADSTEAEAKASAAETASGDSDAGMSGTRGRTSRSPTSTPSGASTKPGVENAAAEAARRRVRNPTMSGRRTSDVGRARLHGTSARSLRCEVGARAAMHRRWSRNRNIWPVSRPAAGIPVRPMRLLWATAARPKQDPTADATKADLAADRLQTCRGLARCVPRPDSGRPQGKARRMRTRTSSALVLGRISRPQPPAGWSCFSASPLVCRAPADDPFERSTVCGSCEGRSLLA